MDCYTPEFFQEAVLQKHPEASYIRAQEGQDVSVLTAFLSGLFPEDDFSQVDEVVVFDSPNASTQFFVVFTKGCMVMTYEVPK